MNKNVSTAVAHARRHQRLFVAIVVSMAALLITGYGIGWGILWLLGLDTAWAKLWAICALVIGTPILLCDSED